MGNINRGEMMKLTPGVIKISKKWEKYQETYCGDKGVIPNHPAHRLVRIIEERVMVDDCCVICGKKTRKRKNKKNMCSTCQCWFESARRVIFTAIKYGYRSIPAVVGRIKNKTIMEAILHAGD